MVQPYEVEENAPLYQRGKPLQECLCCSEGIMRYNYFKYEDGELIDYIECDNLLCGNYVQVAQMRLF